MASSKQTRDDFQRTREQSIIKKYSLDTRIALCMYWSEEQAITGI